MERPTNHNFLLMLTFELVSYGNGIPLMHLEFSAEPFSHLMDIWGYRCIQVDFLQTNSVTLRPLKEVFECDPAHYANIGYYI